MNSLLTDSFYNFFIKLIIINTLQQVALIRIIVLQDLKRFIDYFLIVRYYNYNETYSW